MEKLRVGLVGTSQLSFPGDKKAVFSRAVEGMKKHAKKLGFELIVYDKTITTADDARAAVSELEDKKIDFLLIQHTTYTPGHVAPVLSRINARIGLWAVPEPTKDGVVQLNSFCSINMHAGIIAHYLRNERIKYKWFYGEVDGEMFTSRLTVTVRALTAIKKMCASKVALVGGIAPGFNDLYLDERQINKLFKGIQYNRLHEYDEIKAIAMSLPDGEVKKALSDATDGLDVHDKAKVHLELSARFYLAYEKFIKDNGYNALAVSCWPKFQDDFKYSVCSVVAQLNDSGTPVACEGDIVSAFSMLLLKYLTDDVTMLMDLSDIDENDQTVLMWHCGPAAKRFGKKYSLGVNYHGLPHDDGKNPNCCGIVREMEFDPQHVTLMRLTGENDTLLCMEGDFINGKKRFLGSSGWLGNLQMNKKDISVRNLVNTILVNGFQHHYPIVAGSFSDEISELAAWLDLKFMQEIEYESYLQ